MATTTSPEKSELFTIPNQLTLGRFVLALVLFALIAYEQWAWCLGIFILAAITDWLDGYLARIHKSSSTLGRNLDPLVDKVLMGGTFIFLLPLGTAEGWLLPWMVTVVIARELIITSLRTYLESVGARFGADWLGKLKMVLQCAAVIAIFVTLECPRHFPDLVPTCQWIRNLLIQGMVLATILSGLQYLRKAAQLYWTEPPV